MERWGAKLIALVIILIIPFFCTIIPHRLSGWMTRKGAFGRKILSCMMCFGGGVFFATYILHMGPEVRGILEEALLKPNNITYPVPDVIIASGFFLVFFIEKLTLKAHKNRQKEKLRIRRERCVQINKLTNMPEFDKSAPVQNGKIPNGKPAIPAPVTEPKKSDDDDCCCGGDSGACCKDSAPPATKVQKKAVSIEDLVLGVNLDAAAAGACPLSGTGDCCTDPEENKIRSADVDASLLVMYTPTEPEDEETVTAHNTRSLVLILALSLHRIFEGMSVGLQHSERNVWNLLIAVMCHEMVIGFSMGLQFVKNGFKLRKMLIASFLCSTIMPAGVAIGTCISEFGKEGNALSITNGMLQGVATGTFIYVTFFEILQEEIDAHDTCISKVFAVFVGFLVMAAMSALPEEDPALNEVHVNGIHEIVNATVATVTGSV